MQIKVELKLLILEVVALKIKRFIHTFSPDIIEHQKWFLDYPTLKVLICGVLVVF